MRLILAFCLVFFCLFASKTAAQKFEIRATLVDSLAEKPLEFATVFLFEAKNDSTASTKPLKSAFSDEKGVVKFPGLTPGDYRIEATMVGFQKFSSLKISLAATDVDLGEIRLGPISSVLGQVTITAQKPLLEMKADRVVYNVDADPTNAGGTAIEVLKKVPFLTVDQDDNIRLKGSSNFKVQLNGRSTGMMAKNPKDALRAFPASVIKRIEVITTPGARYDAEGTAGIINIVTSGKVIGVTGNVSTSINTLTQQYHNLSLSAKYGKWGFSGYGGGGGGRVNRSAAFERENFYPTALARESRTGEGHNFNSWMYGNAELAYDIDSLQSLSFYVDGNGGQWRGDDLTTHAGFDTEGNQIESGLFVNDNQNRWPGLTFGSDFVKKFKRPEQEFTISLALDRRFDESRTDNSRTFSAGGTGNTANHFFNNQPEKENTLEINYVHPTGKDQTLSFGVKGIQRRIDNDFWQETMDSTGVFRRVEANSGVFHYSQDVYSGYSEYAFKINKLSLRPGFRYEHTRLNGDVSGLSPFENEFPAYIPTFSTSFQLADTRTLRLSYSRRIQRPSLWYLKPQTVNADPRNISAGNPYLNPEFTHAIEFGYSVFAGQNNISLTLEQGITTDAINDFTEIDASTGVSKSTFYNLGKNSRTAFSANGSATIFKKLTLYSNLTVAYEILDGYSGTTRYRNSGFTGNGYGNLQYNIGKGWRVQGNGWVGVGNLTLQGRTGAWYNYQMGLSKSVLKNSALRFSLLADNFVTKDRLWQSTTNDPLFRTTWKSYSPARAIRFAVNYRFGKLKENVSRKKGVSNSDQKGGGGSGGN